ncbi:Crp/Fnr family transcriptional regulator [Campylobacter sp. VBCF_02 NA5]|uniref:Crp/Fnr family transcriptional regulator n=1 Tax=unclassified Campylobacter TaxID=2593542 RepID=UPI0022EA0C24|nr:MULTISPECIES: Crp/Fnr family transcriptional regulator [unclassified Campylobacter]MDA3053912.1 Crp/Fnr family transcriptional regulator [Campylobacter sp. VBCF_07 NA4]MDA3060201.1 Crp/Fnr family transcriptional regulator [Campylobacter sp. VBCF_02 NA5]WBR54953.1 Crp/Fnr family transcriptional regulator [Campylobacter sp. VBCF_01 NA2]
MLEAQDWEFLKGNFCDKFDFEDDDLGLIYKNAYKKRLRAGQIIYASEDCLGYVLLRSGLLRAFIGTGGKELTVFSIQNGESCMICDTCKFALAQNRLSVEARSECELIVIPPSIFKILKERYPAVLNFALQIVAKRFSQVIMASEQAIFAPLSERIMGFLRENLGANGEVCATHEDIANHIGSAREAVSRVLKEMEKSGKIALSRGKVVVIEI